MIVVGFIAMGSPYVFSVLIAQWLGIAALVIGVISLAMAISGKHTGHRMTWHWNLNSHDPALDRSGG